MVGPTAKKFKIALAKTPYNSLKKVKSGAVKKIIQNLILKVFLLIPYFLEESLKVNKNYPKHHSFHITFSPKKRHLFYKLQLNILKNMLLEHSQKPYSFYKFSSKHLYCTFSSCPRTAFSKYLESKCLFIPV